MPPRHHIYAPLCISRPDAAPMTAFVPFLPLRSSQYSRRPLGAVRPRPHIKPTWSRRTIMTADGTPKASAADAPDSKTPPKVVEADDPVAQVILDENIGGFCSINPRTGKRLEISFREKESLFLDAMQAFFRGESTLTNEEFDALKEELTWQGSSVVTLSRDEFRFLDAAKAYEQGKPVMNDTDFDELKQKLQREGSVVSIQRGPRCSIQRQVTFSDVIPDKRRTFALYLPAGVVMGLLWLSFAFELTPLRNLDPVLSLVAGSPVIFLIAKVLTGLVVPDAEIMVGDCPSCGRRTHVLFGNVLNNKGFQDNAEVKCDKCKALLRVEKDTNRMILVAEGK